MTEITILTEKIVDTYLMPDKLIVIAEPNNKIWYCDKISKEEFIKFCKTIKNEETITLHLKGKSE